MLSLSELKQGCFHYVGIAGTGMSALAQFQAMAGGAVTGSDRLLSSGGQPENARALCALGIRLFPQNGSGITQELAGVVVSSAIEPNNPDLERARALGIPVIHRSDMLSAWVNQYRTIAVAGTSGKSTVTAMIFEILEGMALSPSVITGGNLIRLSEKGLIGNAFVGKSDLLVVESDESDGTLTRYHPHIGLLLNIQKDHKDIAELKEIFAVFLSQCTLTAVNIECPSAAPFAGNGLTFGMAGKSGLRLQEVTLAPRQSTFTLDNVRFTLPLPGRFNVENAAAALAACRLLNLSPDKAVAPLSAFRGVERRFQNIGTVNGVTVIDDFAHNPTKISEAIRAAHLSSKRVLAFFQPHGFGPTRFLKQELIDALATSLTAEDILFMPDIYYAGGTVTRDISSQDITEAIEKRGRRTVFREDRKTLIPLMVQAARTGDMILLMGARDPSLPLFCRDVFDALQAAI
ncbi:MAG: hypothetical protein A2293_05415 [Elusimicrobia bacterium RIFOXYB2_FULL_49_7]|nr:MAG: hypothetical protein A2293_05415 [Elusimicrobia bacterium RIFOXYB2_FULL_49_7]